MGHWCRIYGSNRPGEQFSGKGCKNRICKRCSAKPKSEIDRIVQQDEIFGYLKQSHISQKNIERLRILTASERQEVADLANVTLQVAEVKPYKKRRLKVLARERRDLLEELRRTGLIYAHHC